MKSLKSEESVGGGELEYGTCLAVETVTVIRLLLKCSVFCLTHNCALSTSPSLCQKYQKVQLVFG